MSTDRQKRQTRLFIAFFLLAGAANTLTRTRITLFDTFMFCLNIAIYAGLLLFWIQSLYQRLLPSATRRYMITAAVLTIFYLSFRATVYRIVLSSALLKRLFIYFYYVPLTLIPTLFLMACICISRRDKGESRWSERWLLIPAAALSLLFVTNDLHHLVYQPTIDPAAFSVLAGTYTYGLTFYLAYGWIGLTVAAGVILLQRAGRTSPRRRREMLLIAALWIAVFILYTVVDRFDIPMPYRMPGIHVIFMLAIFEKCIRNRWIPYNENYPGFFAQLDLPVIITDKALSPVWATAVPVRAAADQLKAALAAPIYPDPDTRLQGMPVRAGYTFFTEDESSLNRMNEELQEANELLAEENRLIEREQELIREKAEVEERGRLYESAAREVYPAQKKISELLAAAKPGTPAFRDQAAKILVLTACVKRRANFVLMRSERKTISAGEIVSALREPAHYLKYCGITASVDSEAEREFPCEEAMALYDSYETVIEALLDRTKELWVRLSDTELLFLADVEGPFRTPELPVKAEQKMEEGQLILRLSLTGGGKA
ncbi:MAG: hypothetical protein J5865_03750 [Lachnospiraceae bacterium]|nr:hypothetical protein [Lachnospiraceae bacterium]